VIFTKEKKKRKKFMEDYVYVEGGVVIRIEGGYWVVSLEDSRVKPYYRELKENGKKLSFVERDDGLHYFEENSFGSKENYGNSSKLLVNTVEKPKAIFDVKIVGNKIRSMFNVIDNIVYGEKDFQVIKFGECDEDLGRLLAPIERQSMSDLNVSKTVNIEKMILESRIDFESKVYENNVRKKELMRCRRFKLSVENMIIKLSKLIFILIGAAFLSFMVLVLLDLGLDLNIFAVHKVLLMVMGIGVSILTLMLLSFFFYNVIYWLILYFKD